MRIVLCALALIVSVPAAAAGTGARLHIVGTAPLVVRGTGFEASAPVRISVVYGPTKTATVVRSTPRGMFTFRWAKGVGGCLPLRVAAVSARHRAATGWRPAQDCGAIRVDP